MRVTRVVKAAVTTGVVVCATLVAAPPASADGPRAAVVYGADDQSPSGCVDPSTVGRYYDALGPCAPAPGTDSNPTAAPAAD